MADSYWLKMEASLTRMKDAPCEQRMEWLSVHWRGVLDHLNEIMTNDTLLEQASRRSYVHANGFTKIVLAEGGGKLRLHVWRMPGPDDASGNIHNHRWNLASRVLLGQTRVRVYEAGSSDETFYYQWKYSHASPAGGGDSLEALGQEGLRLKQSFLLPVGGMFASPADVIHQAEATEKESVTLVMHGPAVTASTRVFSAEPIPLSRAVDTNASPGLVRQQLRRIMARLS